MFEIKGKINTAICYAKVVEDEAIEQIRRMCDYEFTKNSKIRIMPDVHAGKGCTIGTTMTVHDKVVPNIVGVDIGCGMYTVNLGKADVDFEKLDEAAHYIPSGMNIWPGRQEKFDLQELRCYRSLKNTKWLERSMGTLGGGNHFIEVDQAQDGTKYLVIHTGSRNLGKQVAEIYQQLAIDLNKGKETYFQQRDEIIRTYKEQGRRAESQAALEKISWNQRETTMPEDLCYLYGKYFEDYIQNITKLAVKCQLLLYNKRKHNSPYCCVHNKMYLKYGIFNTIGGHFFIECKNEKRTPSGDVFLKLKAIISNANPVGKAEAIKFGIIISREKGPETFKQHAVKSYLSRGIVIIAICGEELKKLFEERGNLLDLIERKIFEVTGDVRNESI